VTTQIETVPAASPDTRARSGGVTLKALRGLGHEYRLLVVIGVLVLIWLFFYARQPLFLSSGNLSNLALQTVVTGVLALGVSFVLLIGEIDLSIGAVGGVMAAVMGRLITEYGWNAWLCLIIAVVLGALFGALQGTFIIFGAPSFMVTLGSSIALGGVLLMTLPSTGSIDLSQSSIAKITVTFMTPATSWAVLIVATLGVALLQFTDRGAERSSSRFSLARLRKALGGPALVFVIGAVLITYFDRSRGVPVALVVMLVLYAIAAYVTGETRFGLSVYAVGNNKQASRRAGFKVEKITLLCFTVCGGLAALGGVLAASRVLGVSNQSGGSDYVLEAIAAAVIGGISLFGGRGTVWSALLGALIIGSISNGMDLLGMSTQSKLVVTGLILVIAVTLDAVASRGRLRPVRE
jgi:D-xylose transport system permease protein